MHLNYEYRSTTPHLIPLPIAIGTSRGWGLSSYNVIASNARKCIDKNA
jgi:hypothetical protein